MTKIPFAVVSFLAVQLGGAIWWASQIETKLNLVVGESHMKLVKSRRVERLTCTCQFVLNVMLDGLEDNYIGQQVKKVALMI